MMLDIKGSESNILGTTKLAFFNNQSVLVSKKDDKINAAYEKQLLERAVSLFGSHVKGQELEFSFQEICLEKINWLACFLNANQHITSLDLCANAVGDDLGKKSVKALCETLKGTKNITSLDLGANGLGDSGVRVLCEFFKVNQTLSALSLSGNNIGDPGILALCKVLTFNKTLKSLDLKFNNIHDGGAKALASLLEHNFSLTALGLDGNCITSGNKDLGIIIRCLERNEALEDISSERSQKMVSFILILKSFMQKRNIRIPKPLIRFLALLSYPVKCVIEDQTKNYIRDPYSKKIIQF